MEESRLNLIEKNCAEFIRGVMELREFQKETGEQIRELREFQKETGEQIRELREFQKETDEQIRKSRKETDEQSQKSRKEAGEQMRELREFQKETDEQIRKSRKETDEQMQKSRKEADEQMRKLREFQKETGEQIRELREFQKETDEQMQKSRKETDEQMQKSRKETDEQMQKSREKADEQMRELRETLQRMGKRVDQVTKSLGDLGLVQGEVAEELFYRNLPSIFRDRKPPFHIIKRNLKKKGVAEYDIVATDGKDLLVVEVKNKLKKSMIDDFINKRLPGFKKAFPQYQDCRMSGGIGALVVKDEVGRYAENQGLYVLTQTDDGGAVLLNRKTFKPKEFA